jgi:Rrf2 family transcriptional regulator, cysteine metabolism repressor
VTLLSRKADYALLILAFLHRSTTGGTAKAVADEFKLSRAFVANILKELNHRGYVSSSRGVKGGYTLARPLAAVTLAELLTDLDDKFKLTVCSEHGHTDVEPCDLEHSCPVKGPLNEIHERLTAVLRGVTLAELYAPATPVLQTELTVRNSALPPVSA